MDASARQQGLKSEFYHSFVSCQRLLSHICPFASYTAGNSSQYVVFAYDLAVRPHRSYRHSGGLPRGNPRNIHGVSMWILLQDSWGFNSVFPLLGELPKAVIYIYGNFLYFFFTSTLLLLCKPLSKLDLPLLHQGNLEERT